MAADYRTGVRLLFSFDLQGSTSMKMRDAQKQYERMRTHQPDNRKDHLEPAWIRLISHFFETSHQLFRTRAREFISENRNCSNASINLWKTAGDEILFYSSKILNEHEVYALCAAFDSVLHEIDLPLFRDHKLGVKGVCWAAGFPIRNMELEIDRMASPNFRIKKLSPEPPNFDATVPSIRAEAELAPFCEPIELDFLGPEIDLGFRISTTATPNRLAVSLDVANLLAEVSGKYDVRFYHVGWRNLRGMYGEIPYPIIWIDFQPEGHPLQPRTSYEESISDLHRCLFSCPPASSSAIRKLNDRHLNDAQGYRIRMYLNERDMPLNHKEAWDELTRN